MLHVTSFAPRRAVEGAGVVGHRATDSRIRVVERQGLPVTDPATTWCDLALLLTGTGPDGVRRGLDDKQYAKDERRIEDLRSAGFTVLRIRKDGLRDLGNATARVELALRRAGWVPAR